MSHAEALADIFATDPPKPPPRKTATVDVAPRMPRRLHRRRVPRRRVAIRRGMGSGERLRRRRVGGAVSAAIIIDGKCSPCLDDGAVSYVDVGSPGQPALCLRCHETFYPAGNGEHLTGGTRRAPLSSWEWPTPEQDRMPGGGDAGRWPQRKRAR